MRVVLFGAGASLDCGAVLPKSPPLGRDLFEPLHRLYRTWRSMPNDVVTLFEDHFEDGMAEVIEKYQFGVAPLMQEMAVFFSIFTADPNRENRYRTLLAKTRGAHSVLWSTLNYECIFETAAAQRQMKIAYFADPQPEEEACPMWKLHGSCNFRVEGMEAGRGIRFGTGVTFGGGIAPINPGEVRKHYAKSALYPAMALYADGKPISMSPGPVLEGQQRWGKHVQSASRVLLIGVNPWPSDRHIWEPLAESDAVIAAVGNESAFQDWADSARHAKENRHLGRRWRDCEREVIEFLNQ